MKTESIKVGDTFSATLKKSRISKDGFGKEQGGRFQGTFIAKKIKSFYGNIRTVESVGTFDRGSRIFNTDWFRLEKGKQRCEN